MRCACHRCRYNCCCCHCECCWTGDPTQHTNRCRCLLLLLLYQTKNSGPACAFSSSPASRPRRAPSSALKAPTLLVS